MRRNITTLGSGDATLAAFREAVRQMKALPASDRRNFRNQAQIHQDFCPHGNWLFLPWHRAYLYFFEEICRELTGDDSFALPYWNWTLDRSIPEPFWGDPGDNPLFYAGRVATPASMTGASTRAATLNGILDEPNFQLFGSGSIPLAASQREFAFYGPLEGTPHNYVHGFVGGVMGSFLSPLDPIFWCHHNMIEALWFEWNIRRSNPNPSNADWTDRVFTEFCDRKGRPVRVSVAETLLYPLDAYQFDPLQLTPSSVPRALPPAAEGADERLRQHALSGAPSELTLSEPSVFGERQVVPIRRALSLSTRSASGAERAGSRRPLIRLSGVVPIATGEVVAHVFVNEPGASAATPTDHPHYVGGISFFSHPHGHAPEPLTFYLDATRALGEGERVTSVQVIPVAYEGRATAVRQLEIGRVEVGVLP